METKHDARDLEEFIELSRSIERGERYLATSKARLAWLAAKHGFKIDGTDVVIPVVIRETPPRIIHAVDGQDGVTDLPDDFRAVCGASRPPLSQGWFNFTIDEHGQAETEHTCSKCLTILAMRAQRPVVPTQRMPHETTAAELGATMDLMAAQARDALPKPDARSCAQCMSDTNVTFATLVVDGKEYGEPRCPLCPMTPRTTKPDGKRVTP